MDAILAELAEDTLRPGEFTVQQLHEKHVADGGTKTRMAIHNILKRKVIAGELVARKICLDGQIANAYRPAQTRVE